MSTGEMLCGRYALRGVLGRGGMAEVRDGWDNRLDRAVAVKLLHPGLVADPESRRRFENEARSAAALSHPNIVAIHDSGEHGGVPFIVMERLPGNTLADLVARDPLPQSVARAVLAQVLAALAAAHRSGILHRDIKPGNILFTSTGMAKVAVFGIAKAADSGHTVAGQIVGTVAYLSPQRLAGEPATPSDDLYAVGAVGYEALTGRRAFPQDNLGSLSHAIMTQRPHTVGRAASRRRSGPGGPNRTSHGPSGTVEVWHGRGNELRVVRSRCRRRGTAAPVHDGDDLSPAPHAAPRGRRHPRPPTPDEPNQEAGRARGRTDRRPRHCGGLHRRLVDASRTGARCTDDHDERVDSDDHLKSRGDDHQRNIATAARRANKEARARKGPQGWRRLIAAPIAFASGVRQRSS
jgi:serine/threonine protein kinase